MAVTNHFKDTIKEDENAPLPPMDSYETSFDRTKRLGEEIVFNASSSSSSFVVIVRLRSPKYPGVLPLAIVALRLGTILMSHNDYALRQFFLDGSRTGTIRTVYTKPIDYISG
mmetsp:Transcript_940/g.2062  ORF Transcript_940/g.2062 Transcript_940/m.2062 type:complete len:113 (+) Transcript_940:468-806(+)